MNVFVCNANTKTKCYLYLLFAKLNSSLYAYTICMAIDGNSST